MPASTPPSPSRCAIADRIARWEFARDARGWTPGPAVTQLRVTAEGLTFRADREDPYLVGPEADFPGLPHTIVTLRMRSTGDGSGQIYYGATFSEANSVPFAVVGDDRWRTYRIVLPGLRGKSRLRLDPARGPGRFVVAWIQVEASASPPAERWASPAELRGKKFIGGGQYTTGGGSPDAKTVTSRYLARHPEFVARYPFDGIVVAVPHGEGFLHDILWNTIALTDAAIAPAIADLNAVRWGHLSDNFLNVTMRDGADGRATPNIADDKDWAVLENNATLAARLCRKAKLKGFWLDTEQYSNYAGTEAKFPLGKDAPDVLRRRGAQWIRAVQRELPAVKILITFAWSPDANGYDPLKGVTAFLDGALDGIVAPGQLIHGYENTFYYGQGPGTTNVVNDGRTEGYPGGRARYEAARVAIRDWRALSADPKKYDRFVRTGMAAWVEDDPWNLWSGWPGGSRESFWSNLALALAYSDEYVWVWTEHTHYAHGLESRGGVNPFLASLANQTFNTGHEATVTLDEDFANDPLLRGWHFDFDLLDIGRKRRPDHAVLLMDPDAVPYAWSHEAKAVRVTSAWPVGPRKDATPPPDQRRRYVRPIRPIDARRPFSLAFDFRIDAFGADPIVLGLFHHDQPLANDALTLQIASPHRVTVSLPGSALPLAVPGGLSPGRTHRATIAFDSQARILRAELAGARTARRLPIPTAFGWDEIGLALREGPPRGRPATRYALERARLRR